MAPQAPAGEDHGGRAGLATPNRCNPLGHAHRRQGAQRPGINRFELPHKFVGAERRQFGAVIALLKKKFVRPVKPSIDTTYTRNSLSARARPERLRDPRRRPDSNVPGHAQPRHEHDLYGTTSQRRVASIFAAHRWDVCRLVNVF